MKPKSSQTMSRLVCTMRDVERDLGKERKVADHVPQAEDDAEDDLADKGPIAAMK